MYDEIFKLPNIFENKSVFGGSVALRLEMNY